MPRDYEFDRLRTEMNGAWEAKEYAKRELDAAWDEVQSTQQRYGYRIEQLTRDHDRAFEDMKSAFEDASRAFERGDHDEAARCSARGRELRNSLAGYVSERRGHINECKRAQARHRVARDVYQDKKREFMLAKERFDDHKAMRAAAKQDAAFRAGVQHYGDDVKVVHKDGKSHVYFGGVGEPDGDGHAHYVLDEFGNIEYRRDPFADRGPQNYR
jgi:outer membrane murein-binding lipoprotein Lpp